MVEASPPREAFVERALAGVAERRVAKIVGERQCLGEVLVEPQRAGERTGDLRNFERMGQARAIVIALVKHENLGLVFKAPERCRMNDAITVAAVGIAGGAGGFRVEPAAACRRIGGKWRPPTTGFDRHSNLVPH